MKILGAAIFTAILVHRNPDISWPQVIVFATVGLVGVTLAEKAANRTYAQLKIWIKR